MFAALFVAALMTAHVTAELPSYIHPCGRKDPNYEQCIANNVNDLKNKVCEGIPELNVPPNEPLIIDKLIIYDTVDTKLYLRDGKVRGICDFVLNFVHADLDRLHYDFDITVKHLRMNTTYDFDIRLLVQIAHTGILYVTSDNVKAKIGLDFRVITKKGKKYIYVSKMNTMIDIKAFDLKFDENENGLVELHEIISNVVVNNEEKIISIVKPTLEKVVSKQFISVLNDVIYTRYEELFPERT